MPAKRKYNVKGTNDFLVLAAIFFFLCLWAVKDAWFPSEKVIRKHPPEIAVSFGTEGSVEKILVEEGHSIGEQQLLAKLRTDRLNLDYESAKGVYTEAKKKYMMMEQAVKNATSNGASDDGLTEIEQRRKTAETAMHKALAEVTDLRNKLDDSQLLAPSKGVVTSIDIVPHSMVKAGEVVMTLDPKDHFYLFNKSLSIFSFLAFWVFLAIHILAR